jgi:hypothetical protein
MSNPENIHAVLRQGELGSLLVELQKIKALNQAILPLLPEQFRDSCQVSRIDKGCATLDVANGSMATMLRYEIPNILSELRKQKDWLGLASLKTRVKVDPTLNLSQANTGAAKAQSGIEQPERKSHISDETRQTLQSMAEDITDQELRAAIQALVSHL